MKTKTSEALDRAAHQSAFSRAVHSIRTRYSLATASFILLSLLIFYVGGRIVIIHLMREAEQQVEEIGYDISRLAYRQADAVRRESEKEVGRLVSQVEAGAKPDEVLRGEQGGAASLLISFSAGGTFSCGAVRAAGGVVPVSEADIAPYAERFRAWSAATRQRGDGRTGMGIVQLRGSAYYVFMHPYVGGGAGGWIVVGAAFDSASFTSHVNEGFGGMDVRVVNRKVAVSVAPAPRSSSSAPGGRRNDFGIVPMLSEAMNFYSGGFWNLGPNPFEAVFAVRDIAGNAVSMITVSLPASLSAVTRSALGRLSFFIAVAGILIILPVFWFQSYVLLNPLTKMTEAIRRLGENHRSIDCPYLEWEGKDEFAMLALSVNRMLETISSRAVEVAQVEARHRALIDGVPDAMVVFDRRGRLVSVTKQPEGTPPLVGFKTGEPLQAEVFGEGSSADFTRAVESVFSSGSVVARHLEVLSRAEGSADGHPRHFEVRLAKMDDVFALAIVRDVTKEVAEHNLRLAAEARSLDVLKRESLTMFAAGIAHDVNNVLAVILGTVDSVSAARGETSETEVVRDAAKRGVRMMKELIEFAGDGKVSLVRLSPEFLVRDVQTILARTVGKNVAVQVSAGKGLPDVDADPNRFWKVFFNIVKNAGEALGSRPGHITLTAEAFEMTEEASVGFMSNGPLTTGPGVLFKISDDGPGISPDVLPRLFDPYVSSKEMGRGLGLATVRTIVETHGGGLKVDSEIEKGTTFSIYLPKSKLASAKPAEEAKETRGGELPDEVLVVDDDEAILKTVSMLLKALGVKAHCARDRSEAMSVMRRAAPGIGTVLLDAHLGGIDVVRLFKALRLSAPAIHVVMTSGSKEEEVMKIFGGRPYSGFLSKPFTLAELKSAICTPSRG